MGWPTAKRPLVISVLFLAAGLAVCGWQVQEHAQFKRGAAQSLINRGRDITSTLGVLLRSQRRFGRGLPKERLEAQLQAMIAPKDLPKELPKELKGVAILAATGEPVASAGERVELPADMLKSNGVFWREHDVTIMNLMDLDAPGDNGARPRPPTIVTDERTRTALSNRRSPDPRPADAAPATDASGATVAPAPLPAAASPTPAAATTTAPTTVPATTSATASASTPATTAATPPPAAPSNPNSRPLFGQPSWMSREEYDAIIHKQGAHSLVLSLSTDEMIRSVNADLLLRSLVSLLAMGGAIASLLAWRNLARNADLQIRLVKAGEMNAHLKEMNLAAAGLAHETRNPLNLIRGLAQMITMQTKEAPKLREHATTIIEEADRVTVQLNEFINYSKPREAHLSPVQVTRLIADVARTLLPDLEEKRIQLHQVESPLFVEADEQLARQAIFNVLLNATQAVGVGGKIDVRLTPVDSQRAVLEISDDGPGVPAAERASIFKPYVTMRPKGVGLGLAIVAQIAAVHHWEVACLANEPRGAVFRFSRLKIVLPPA